MTGRCGGNKLKVAVLIGGWSAEREVSLKSGEAVCCALSTLGHDIKAMDIGRDVTAIMDALEDFKPDIVFNALHGRGGEDGIIQGLLEIAGIPYTHSGVMASAIAMDKPMAKTIVSSVGVRCAEGRVITTQEAKEKGWPFPAPFVIKPPCEGSSVGVRIVMNDSELSSSNSIYNDLDTPLLIERYVPGRELTVGLMGDKASVKAITVTELRPHRQFYDYEAKYTGGITEHIVPAQIPEEVFSAAMRMAEKAYAAIGCNGIARADIRWDDSIPGTDGLYFLEMNTQPGFTSLSLVPEQAAHIGMSFPALVDWILEHPIRPARRENDKCHCAAA